MRHRGGYRAARKSWTTTRRGALALVAGLAMPALARGRDAARVAVLHPMTGPFAAAAALARAGTRLGWRMAGADEGAVELVETDLGSVLEAVPEMIEKLAREGVSALVGGLTSPHAQAVAIGARAGGLPFMVDVAGAGSFLGPDFPRVFRFAAGFDQMLREGVVSLAAMNTEAGNPARSVLVVREPRGFAANAALRAADRFDEAGFEVLPILDYRSAAGADALAEDIGRRSPDIVVPLAPRALLTPLLAALGRNSVPLKAIFSLLALSDLEEDFGAMPGYELLVDANHGFNVATAEGGRFRDAIAGAGLPTRPEVFLSANAMRCLCVAIRSAASADPGEIAAAIRRADFAEPAMPYDRTAFHEGHNLGARGVLIQIQDGRPTLVAPRKFQAAEVVYPRPA